MTNPHQAWTQLTRLALLGTRQTPEPLPTLSELELPAAESREQQVMLLAGALGLVRKAGFQPLVGPVISPETTGNSRPEPETQPTLGPVGRQHLQLMLDGTHADLLPDYLRDLARCGRRVPPTQLVALLEYARTRPELPPVLEQVLGTRGQWLATLNPQWRPLLATGLHLEDETLWETGSLRQRRQFLTALRRIDATRSRELLAAALPQEPAKNQAQLLEILQENLSPADGPLLEQYLGSKSKEVRQAVLPLLVCLPSRPIQQRLWERAEPLVQLVGKKLVVTLPEAWDKTWLAYGLEQKDARFQGDKAALLGQLLTLLPPQRWAAHWLLTPLEILDLAADTEWLNVLLIGWAEAAVLHHDASWAAAVLEWYHAPARKKLPTLPLAGLARQVPSVQLAAMVLPQLSSAPHLTPEASWLPLLQLVPVPWPTNLTHRVVELLTGALGRPEQLHRLYYAASQLLEHMARVVPPEQYELCAAPLQPLLEQIAYLHSSLARLLNTLYFRQQLAASLTEPADAR